ncbi:DNA-primase RepB domain-containing protein [Paracoccus sp. TOH]|uniref:DNA-primase RepB domain-containing protein n=1 Tax=Paracoccus sp. TOH TaxID=1263728 RepID=UPI0025B21CC6|nr:DNA-primase RepB domain-containing protein [Paracoccus sp. TOH]WJS84225.1 RepB family DNA primase [Paracoccus sp. TOH]
MSGEDLMPDIAAATSFLRDMHADRPMTLVAIKEGRGPIAKAFGMDVATDAVDARISEHNGQGYNIYWQVNRAVETAHNKKARKRDITEVWMLHVDVDDLSDDALERLKAFEPRPSVILFSGGGYQAFWLLDQPLADIPKAEALNRRIAAKLGGDNCHNAEPYHARPRHHQLAECQETEGGSQARVVSCTLISISKMAPRNSGHREPSRGWRQSKLLCPKPFVPCRWKRPISTRTARLGGYWFAATTPTGRWAAIIPVTRLAAKSSGPPAAPWRGGARPPKQSRAFC